MAEWKTFGPIELPEPLPSALGGVSNLLTPITTALDLVSGALNVLKTFMIDLDSPILMLVEQILGQIKDTLDNIRKTGVYILVDMPLSPDSGEFFTGANEIGLLTEAAIEMYNDQIDQESDKISETDSDGAVVRELKQVGTKSLEVLKIDSDTNAKRKDAVRRRINYFGENIVGGMAGFRNRFRASVVDFKDRNRPSFGPSATVGGAVFVLNSSNAVNLLNAMMNVLSWFDMQIPAKSRLGAPANFRARPVNKATYIASLGKLDNTSDLDGNQLPYNAVALTWDNVAEEYFGKTASPSLHESIRYLVAAWKIGDKQDEGGNAVLFNALASPSPKQTFSVEHEKAEDGRPIHVMKVVKKDLELNTWLDDRTMQEGDTFAYKVYAYTTDSDNIPEEGQYIGTDGWIYQDGNFNPELANTMTFDPIGPSGLSLATSEREVTIHDPSLGDWESSYGTYPDWRRAALTDVMPSAVGRGLNYLEAFLIGLQSGAQGVSEGMIEMIDILSAKIDTLSELINMIQNLIDAMANLQAAPVAMLSIPFDSGGIGRVVGLVNDPNLPGSPPSTANDFTASISILVGGPMVPQGTRNLMQGMFS